MIRLGIVGCNYGRIVQLPAFRTDPRCVVIAIAGSEQARTAEIARQSGIAAAFGDWKAMLERADIDAVAIATPPQLQPQIAIRALERGKAVFAEKPMAADLGGATDMLKSAGSNPTMVDFTFIELPAWQKAKALIDAGAIGRLRHIIVTWNVENLSTQRRLKHWKTSAAAGGGALGNLASHSMHYLEWFCGPIIELSAHLAHLPDDPEIEVTAIMSFTFAVGAVGSFTVSSASYIGSGHRLEFYGEVGTLVLANSTSDYMRGFTLSHARRPATALEPVAIDRDPQDNVALDARIAPVSRLARRFIDAIEQGKPASPGFAEGYRAQFLLDAVRRAHTLGRRVDTREPVNTEVR